MERKLVAARVDLESAAYFWQIVEPPYPKIKPTLGKCHKISTAIFRVVWVAVLEAVFFWGGQKTPNLDYVIHGCSLT